MTILLVLISVVVYLKLSKYINYRFRTNNITKIIYNSKFAGYAIFINKNELLTTYELTNNFCRDHKIYVLYNNDYYYVTPSVEDSEYGLSILRFKNDKTNNFKNYALLSNKDKANKLFTIDNVNNYFEMDLYRTIFNSADYYLYQRSFNIFSQVQGKPILDENFSLYGIVLMKSGNNIFNIFNNKIVAVNKDYIREFLNKRYIKYTVNTFNLNLGVIKEYEKKITAKVICAPTKKIIPRTVSIRR